MADPTIEDLQKQIGAKDGVIGALEKTIEQHSTTIEKKDKRIGELEKQLEEKNTELNSFVAEARKKLEEEVHSRLEKFDCEGKSDEELHSVIVGFDGAIENGKVKKTAGTPPPAIPHSTKKGEVEEKDKPKRNMRGLV